MLGRLGLAALVVLASSGCVAVDDTNTIECPAALSVANTERFDLSVRLNGQRVADVTPDSAVTLISGQPGLPPLPWEVAIIQLTDGTVRGSGTITDDTRHVGFGIGPPSNRLHALDVRPEDCD